jgi:mannose-6-phosphate isomerase-like protein (cupin superfamily)
VRFVNGGVDTGGTFALVEHPVEPRTLAAPIHTHRHKDEYTYVLEGTVGVQVGEEIRITRPGDLIFKPRNVPHAFWNPGDAPARTLEIILAGFERYFREIAPLLPPANNGPLDVVALGAVMAKYGLKIDFESIPSLAERHRWVVE